MADDTHDIFSMLSRKQMRLEPQPEPVPEQEPEPAPAEPPRERYMPSFPGRQSKDSYNLQKLAKEATEEAFNCVLNIMRHAEDDSTRLEAAKQILDRGWGKPSVKIQAETVTYTLKDIEEKLLSRKEEIDIQVIEARRIERERIAEYLTSDAEVVGDATSHSE